MDWMEAIPRIVEEQRRFFRSGATLDVAWRLEQLKRLKKAVMEHRKDLEDALGGDLGRAPF